MGEDDVLTECPHTNRDELNIGLGFVSRQTVGITWDTAVQSQAKDVHQGGGVTPRDHAYPYATEYDHIMTRLYRSYPRFCFRVAACGL